MYGLPAAHRHQAARRDPVQPLLAEGSDLVPHARDH